MTTDAYKRMSAKVAKTAGEAVNLKGYVTAIDIFLGLDWLTQEKLASWRRGQVPYLEQVVIANLSKISDAMKEFRKWAAHSKLKPSYTAYKHKSITLRFSKSGNPKIEEAYCTHYVLISKVKKEDNLINIKENVKVERNDDNVIYENPILF